MDAHDDPRLRRIEEYALAVTNVARTRFHDGWMLRVAPGPSKRGRSVNAMYGGNLPVGDKIRHCEAVYAEAGLPTVFRITPFDRPAGLDDALAAAGYVAFDATDVLVAPLTGRARESVRGAEVDVATPEPAAFVESVVAVREGGARERALLAERLANTAVHWRGFVARRGDEPLASGQLAWEARELVGVFDVATLRRARGQRIATTLCAAMLDAAWSAGAREAYLQVTVDNAAAQALYRALGFAPAYRYHYRARPGEAK